MCECIGPQKRGDVRNYADITSEKIGALLNNDTLSD
jgi:hypothetical protein